MTKKHFDAFAAALLESKPLAHTVDGREERIAPAQWRYDCARVADVCARFNPKFDRGRFLAACGVTDHA